jgi:hypothetical protein
VEETIILEQIRFIRVKFIRDTAVCSINISGDVRFAVMASIEEKNLKLLDKEKLRKIFLSVKKEILLLLTKDSFKRFQFSQAYFDALNLGRSSKPQKQSCIDCCFVKSSSFTTGTKTFASGEPLLSSSSLQITEQRSLSEDSKLLSASREAPKSTSSIGSRHNSRINTDSTV